MTEKIKGSGFAIGGVGPFIFVLIWGSIRPFNKLIALSVVAKQWILTQDVPYQSKVTFMLCKG